MSANLISLDQANRPSINLAASYDGPSHHVVIDSTRPVVNGFCTTCYGDWHGSAVADRKARACAVMVTYLGEVNRNRRMAEDLRQQVDLLVTS